MARPPSQLRVELDDWRDALAASPRVDGHSTILMTMLYAHLAPGGGREFLAALDARVIGKKVEAV